MFGVETVPSGIGNFLPPEKALSISKAIPSKGVWHSTQPAELTRYFPYAIEGSFTGFLVKRGSLGMVLMMKFIGKSLSDASGA